MTGERPRRLVRVVAWLLTPLVAWAASFLGGWMGAAIGLGTASTRGGLLWLGTGAVVGGVVGVIGWIILLRRWAAPGHGANPPASGEEGK